LERIAVDLFENKDSNRQTTLLNLVAHSRL